MKGLVVEPPGLDARYLRVLTEDGRCSIHWDPPFRWPFGDTCEMLEARSRQRCTSRLSLALVALLCQTATAQLNCESIACARDCNGACGWSQIFGLCVSGAHTAVSELSLCRDNATVAPLTTTGAFSGAFSCVSDGFPTQGVPLSSVAIPNSSSCDQQAAALTAVVRACASDAPPFSCITSDRIPSYSFVTAGCRTSDAGVISLNQVGPFIVSVSVHLSSLT